MAVATFQQTDFTAQTVASYAAAIDADMAVLTRPGDAFAPHAQATPDMSVALDAGHIFNGTTLLEVAAQSSGTIAAPTTNLRIDRIVIDQFSGALAVIAGTESASPVPPPIPAGRNPVAQILLSPGATAITNAMITDERSFAFLGGGIVSIAAGTGLTGGGNAGAVTLSLIVPVAVAHGGTGVAAAPANQVFAGPASGGAAPPGFRALVGADLPTPSPTTLGGVQSYGPIANQWIDAISAAGIPTSSQPSFSAIAGQAALSQLPDIPNNTVLGNTSGATAAPSAITITSLLDTVTAVQGSILYRDAGAWAALPPGSNGQFLQTQGAGAAPQWAAAGGGVPGFLLMAAGII